VFKFVPPGAADLDEIQVIVDVCQLSDISVLPEGTDAGTVTARLRDLAEPVLAGGWQLSP
jgi:7-carboxy-7-deazaguanine synthase